jgi:hypothetical protein
MSEFAPDYSGDEPYEYSGGIIRRGDPVVITHVYAGKSAQVLFGDIAFRRAVFIGNRQAYDADGRPEFDGLKMPHFEVVIEDEHGEALMLELRGFECDWSTPREYAALIDAEVAAFGVPDFPPE